MPGIWSLNPSSLAALELLELAFELPLELPGVLYCGGVSGLRGARVGIRGNTSGGFKPTDTVEPMEYNSCPFLFVGV